MAKLSRKYFAPLTFTGVVRLEGKEIMTLSAQGRNKQEAIKNLRAAFRDKGILTQPDPATDLLEMENGNQLGFRARHPENSHTHFNVERTTFWVGNADGTSLSSKPAGS
jgi:hypothetical protein